MRFGNASPNAVQSELGLSFKLIRLAKLITTLAWLSVR